LLVLGDQFGRERGDSLVRGQCWLSALVMAPWSAVSGSSWVSQCDFLIASRNAGSFNFLRLNLLLSTSSCVAVSMHIRIGIWSTIIAQSGWVPH
jgi:hypothetical protein